MPPTSHPGTPFHKITGPSGDWIVMHDPTGAMAWTREEIRHLTDRSFGIGADGVVVLAEPLTGQDHQTLQAWGATGEPLDHMTEPARVATRALASWDRLDPQATSHHRFRTATGLITTVYTPAYIGVDIGQWAFGEAEMAQAAGSDALVMAAGLTDPRPGLTVHLEDRHVVIAVETPEELWGINLGQQPSVEPAPTEAVSLAFVVPQEPLMAQGMGHLTLRHYSARGNRHDNGSAAAAATIAFQTWSGLQEPRIWQLDTPDGKVIVQLHAEQRVSTFMQLNQAFTGRF